MAELTINTADIAAAIQKNLDGFQPSLEQSQVGRVLEVGDGIARVSGLPGAAVNELLQFENGSFGLALNLDEGSIGAVVLGEVDDIKEVDKTSSIKELKDICQKLGISSSGNKESLIKRINEKNKK